MERLQLKVARLETLWSCLGTDTDPLSIEDKLKPALRELDKVLEYEQWRRQVLMGDIEDIMASIECGCQILGISLETLNEMDGMDGNQDWKSLDISCLWAPSWERKKSLTVLNNKLANEIRQRRLHIKEWLLNVADLCEELGVAHTLGCYESYHDDLSWATMQKVSCTMRDLCQKQQANKLQFEHTSRCIHYYWHILGESVNVDDPIDIAIHNLCDSITIAPDQAFDMNDPPSMTNNDNLDLYYRHPLPYPLSLQDDLLTTLRTKAHDLASLYSNRLGQFHHYVNSIQTLWEELKVPDHKKFTIHYSLHMDNMIKLKTNFDEMKTIVKAMTDEYLDTIRQDLLHLWDECLLTQGERDEFMTTLYHKANTMDTVYLIVDNHMAYLKHILSSSQTVTSIMKDRKDLIQKMIDFETSASDPKRLFQASFRLMEEERWRKTCFPTLLQLDNLLIKAVQDFERMSEKHLLVGNKRYLDMLMDEISDRTTNQTFFGFLNTDLNHDRPVRNKSRPNTTTKKTKTLSLPPVNSTSTLNMPSNDSQSQNRRHSNTTLKQRSSFTRIPTDLPLPMSSASTKLIQLPLSISPKRFDDAKKYPYNHAIPANIIPQQCKSKSDSVQHHINPVNTTANRYKDNHAPITMVPTTDGRQRQHDSSPPASPNFRYSPRSKTSQIPVRSQMMAEQATSTPSQQIQQQQQHQQQHQLTVQCA